MDKFRAFFNQKIDGARSLFSKETLKDDTVAGVVLGVESVPDGLAGGLLAGVNPIYGLYGYMVGTFTGGLFTSSSFMAVQATGAMAIVVADVGLSSFGESEDRALFTLAVLTGVIMFAAGGVEQLECPFGFGYPRIAKCDPPIGKPFAVRQIRRGFAGVAEDPIEIDRSTVIRHDRAREQRQQ